MLSQITRVVEVSDQYILLEPEQSECYACGVAKTGGCGVSNLSAFFQQHPRILKVSNPGGISPGQQVEILVAERLFFLMLGVQYLLPLFAVLVSAVLVGLYTSAVLWQLFATISGLYIGIQLSCYFIARVSRYTGFNVLGLRTVADSQADQIQSIRVLSP